MTTTFVAGDAHLERPGGILAYRVINSAAPGGWLMYTLTRKRASNETHTTPEVAKTT